MTRIIAIQVEIIYFPIRTLVHCYGFGYQQAETQRPEISKICYVAAKVLKI